jgi:uncharacterized protein
VEITLKIAQRDPSTSLGMTVLGGRFLLIFVAILASAIFAYAAETIPPRPERYFNDYAGVVSPSAALRFNERLAQFERDTSNQFVVAVFPSFPSSSSLEDFTQRTAQAWKVWQAGKNNGVILFVFVRDRRMRIETAYGLEGALPDITCNEIIRDEIAPHFKSNDYEGGLGAGINSIIAATKGEYHGKGRTNAESRGDKGGTAGLLVFLFIIVIILLALRASRRFGGYRYTGGGGPFISGNWGSGGGWSSGSSGGGFSSFVGGGGSSGGFGGGGASGSW